MSTQAFEVLGEEELLKHASIAQHHASAITATEPVELMEVTVRLSIG